MFQTAAQKIADRLCRQDIIEDTDKELYVYGFNMLITVSLNIISTIIIGLLFGMVFESIAFLAAYIPLRSYAGGYHARTPLRCYIISLLLIVLILLALRSIGASVLALFVLSAIGTIICVTMSPVEDVNKTLDETEIKVYRKKTLIILSAEMIIFIISIFVLMKLAAVISIALSLEGIMLILGKIVNIQFKSTNSTTKEENI